MAVLVNPDWQHSRDPAMDLPSNPRQTSSPASDSPAQPQLQQHLPQQMHISQQQHQQSPYVYPVQQQPQGSWTPSIAAAPFYPSFYQGHQQQPSPQPYPSPIPQQPYFDPANAQLARWAYQQMMLNSQHAYSQVPPQHHSPQQRTSPNTPPSNDYFTQNQLQQSPFSSFPSGTPPPHAHRNANNEQQQGNQLQQQPGQGQQNGQYSPGFHPYRRPNRQQSQHSPDTNDWRSGPVNHIPHPPYARPEASGSTSSVNSSSSRQRTNSNQSANSGHNIPSANSSSRSRNNGSPAVSMPASARSSPPSVPSPTSTSSPLRAPHHRNGSSSSSNASTTSSTPASPSTNSVSSTSSSTAPASSGTSRAPSRPSPLSQGTFTAGERRMSRDDSDLAAMLDPSPSASMLRSGGLKGRLRRALSFNAAQTLKEEEADDDESIKASAFNGASSKSKAKAPSTGKPGEGDDAASTATVQTKKKSRAASLFNSRLNASTDNISLSSTVSSASMMIRKLGSMGKLARRNSLAGITSLFKDKDKNKDGEGKDKKGKKKDKTAKGQASEASVSHVTAELDRTSSNDWNVGGEMAGLSPAAKLARQHTLKSNAEAAAKAKAQQEAQAAAASAAAGASANVNQANGNGTVAGVPAWDKNTTTRQGSVSPVKGGGRIRVNEDGTRIVVEDEDEESDEGHYGSQQAGQSFHAGWDDDDWDDGEGEGDGDEDVTIRMGMENTSLDDREFITYPDDPEAWAVDVRRSVERTRKPAKGILKNASHYDQQIFVVEQPNPNRVRSNSYNSPGQSELGPLARIPSPDPDHIDGLHKHNLHSSAHGHSNAPAPTIPPLSFESSPKELPETPTQLTYSHSVSPPPPPEKPPIFQHPNMNSSAPVLPSVINAAPPLTRTTTSPSKQLAFANNLSIYDTFSASVYDRRSEPATWSRLTPALAQRIKEELNSYKMEEMEVHAASRIHTQFFV